MKCKLMMLDDRILFRIVMMINQAWLRINYDFLSSVTDVIREIFEKDKKDEPLVE